MKSINGSSPRLSVVVIFHNMRREAERTLYSLGSDYQLDVSNSEYEVIAIDNGSGQPLEEDDVRAFGPNFQYHFFETDSASPATAINFGAARANGEYVAVIVDGARMVTPGIVRESLRALQAFERPFVCSLGWHLGPDVQNLSILEGYSQQQEDRLLDSINWRTNGYGLFEISTIAPSSGIGFLGGMPTECSWFAMSRSEFIQMGGYDERFQSPGGGQVNHDFLSRVLGLPETFPIVILGEGSFHQIHGGVASNVPWNEHPAAAFKAETLRIHGRPNPTVNVSPYYLGKMPASARKFINPLARGLNSRARAGK